MEDFKSSLKGDGDGSLQVEVGDIDGGNGVEVGIGEDTMNIVDETAGVVGDIVQDGEKETKKLDTPIARMSNHLLSLSLDPFLSHSRDSLKELVALGFKKIFEENEWFRERENIELRDEMLIDFILLYGIDKFIETFNDKELRENLLAINYFVLSDLLQDEKIDYQELISICRDKDFIDFMEKFNEMRDVQSIIHDNWDYKLNSDFIKDCQDPQVRENLLKLQGIDGENVNIEKLSSIIREILSKKFIENCKAKGYIDSLLKD